jgi:hypothetical protein
VTDDEILEQIDQLVERVHELQARAQEDDGLEADDAVMLIGLEQERDRCWDLIRQRRAKRDAGLDPDEAEVRDAETVESYRQ